MGQINSNKITNRKNMLKIVKTTTNYIMIGNKHVDRIVSITQVLL